MSYRLPRSGLIALETASGGRRLRDVATAEGTSDDGANRRSSSGVGSDVLRDIPGGDRMDRLGPVTTLT